MRTYMYLKRLAMAAMLASALTLTLTAGAAQADCVGIYCQGPTGPIIQQQQALAAEALLLADQISNPVAKAAVESAVAQSNALANQANALLLQAQKTNNPVVKAKLKQAALVAATAAKALAQLAAAFAKATLKHEGKHPAADAAAVGHAAASVQAQVKALLVQAKRLATHASANLKQAAKLLRHPTKKNQVLASGLIAQAKLDVAKATALAKRAQALVANTKSAHKTVALLQGQTKTINVGYPNALRNKNARYSCTATVSGPARRSVKILSRGSALGGSVCRVKAKNTSRVSGLDGTARITVTATTTT